MGLGLKRVCWYINVLVSLSGGGEWRDLEKQVGLKQVRRYVSVFVSLSKGGGGVHSLWYGLERSGLQQIHCSVVGCRICL